MPPLEEHDRPPPPSTLNSSGNEATLAAAVESPNGPETQTRSPAQPTPDYDDENADTVRSRGSGQQSEGMRQQPANEAAALLPAAAVPFAGQQEVSEDNLDHTNRGGAAEDEVEDEGDEGDWGKYPDGTIVQPHGFNGEPAEDFVVIPPKDPVGNSTIACSGRCVRTQDWWHVFILAFFVLVPVGVFSTSVVPHTEWWSIVIVWVLSVAAILANLLAVTMDPGIIPPASVTGFAYDPEELVRIEYRGAVHDVRVCRTCLVPKPPGSGHCRWCDNCVEDFDHHCGVLGACVAKRNFRFFAYFMDMSMLLAGYVFVRSIIAAAQFDWDTTGQGDHATNWRAVATIGCILYSFCGGCCVCGPFWQYSMYACEGATHKMHVVEMREAHAATGRYPTVPDRQFKCSSYFERKCGPNEESQVLKYVGEERPEP